MIGKQRCKGNVFLGIVKKIIIKIFAPLFFFDGSLEDKVKDILSNIEFY